MRWFHSFSFLTLLALPGSPIQGADTKPLPNFALKDVSGKSWKLADQKAKIIVFAFLSCECPMSNGYLPTLMNIAEKYGNRGVVFVGIHADPEETAAIVSKHRAEYKVTFPQLLDPLHQAAKPLQAKTTPEVIVVDESRQVRYRGRIDDSYSARMKRKAKTERDDLEIALQELLAAKPVTLAETKAFGCPIPDPARSEEAAASVTFHKDVVPIVQAHCQSCHRPDQVGPFSLMNYKQVSRWIDTSLEEIHAKRMPPWKSAPNPLLSGARSLPAPAVETLEKWVAQGKPEGNAKDAPPPATFTDGWTLGQPDLILEAPSDVTIGANGRDHFRVQVFPTSLPEDRYIVALEVKPGNPRVVHHTLQLIDTSGRGRELQDKAKTNQQAKSSDRGPGYEVNMGWGFAPDRNGLLGAWAPGILPKKLPEGIGQKLPKGADICVQFHYHRTGKEEKDRTRIGLYFAKKPVALNYRTIPIPGVFLAIPAGDSAFKVENSWRLSEDVTLYRLMPHMHLLGQNIQLTASTPDGKETTLIDIPHWDYNWQEQYELKEPIKLPQGTVLRVRATYDNSATNPHNPNSPPKAVRIGEQTTDEMCFVFLGISTESTARRLIAPVGINLRKR